MSHFTTFPSSRRSVHCPQNVKLWKILCVCDISLNIASCSDRQKVILLECVPLLLTNWPIMTDKFMWPLVYQTAFVTHLWHSHYIDVTMHSHTLTKELKTKKIIATDICNSIQAMSCLKIETWKFATFARCVFPSTCCQEVAWDTQGCLSLFPFP